MVSLTLIRWIAIYPMDSDIQLLTNLSVMISNEVAGFFCLFTGWVNELSHFVKVININIFDLFKCKREI